MRILIRSRLVIGTVLVAGALLTVALWPVRSVVDAVPVTRGAMDVTIDDEGTTRVRHRFIVSAPVAGRLDRINLDPGDPVVAGRTVVARLVAAPGALLDPRARAELDGVATAAQASLGQARASRDQAQVALTRTRASAARQEQLGHDGLVSPDAVEAARAEARVAEEALHAATFALARVESEWRAARARLATPAAGGAPVIVLAPVDGVILTHHRESQAVVPAGEPLLDIGDPRDLEVVADLLSSDAVRVTAGDRAWLDRWGGGAPIAARVRRIEPSGFTKVSALGVEEQRVNILIDPVNPADVRRLGDGFRVDVRLVVWTSPDAVQVPVGSLFRRGQAWAVFVVVDGRAVVRTVTIGQRNGVTAEILSGLSIGETVIVYPADTLADGARVRPRGA